MRTHAFSVPFYSFDIANWEEQKDVLKSQLPTFEDSVLQSYQEHHTDFFDMDNTSPLPDYADTVIEMCKPCFKDIVGDDDILFTGMWTQTSYKHQRHSIHNHGGTGYSCVLYVEFDPEVHRATTFLSPYNDPWSGSLDYYSPTVSEGSLVVFPSTIPHWQEPNQSDKPRTIVSFNIRGHVDLVKRRITR